MFGDQISHRNNLANNNTDLLYDDMFQFNNCLEQLPTLDMPESEGITILIVDDEEGLRSLLEVSLQRSGFNVITACDGRSALELFATYSIDMVLLDVIMPDIDGFAVCAEIRKQSDTPIVMLTALNRPDDIVHGFDLGADDYIPKPFTFREVEVRIQSILRRICWIQETPTFRVMSYGDIVLNDELHLVLVRGQEIDLTPIEYQLLYRMMCTPDQPIGKEELFHAVWGYDQSGGTNLVEVAIRRLREKIEMNPSKPNYLITVRGAGYKFDTTHAQTAISIDLPPYASIATAASYVTA